MRALVPLARRGPQQLDSIMSSVVQPAPSRAPASRPLSDEPSTYLFDALLFDMDGTLVDSTAAIVKHWEK